MSKVEIIPLHDYNHAELQKSLLALVRVAGGVIDYDAIFRHAESWGYTHGSVHDALHTLCLSELVTFEDKVATPLGGDA